MEAIIRLNDNHSDSEILIQDGKELVEKFVDTKELLKIINLYFPNYIDKEELEIDNLNSNLVYFKRFDKEDVYFYNFPEQKIKCTYSNKGYSINHPNTLFIVYVNNNERKYTNVKAYCYKEFNGEKTKLFLYPFPNMLGTNSICTGTISREATDPVKAIYNIIEGNYTHGHTGYNKESPFYETKNFFKYISKNPFPYDSLVAFGRTLRMLIKEEKTK